MSLVIVRSIDLTYFIVTLCIDVDFIVTLTIRFVCVYFSYDSDKL